MQSFLVCHMAIPVTTAVAPVIIWDTILKWEREREWEEIWNFKSPDEAIEID